MSKTVRTIVTVALLMLFVAPPALAQSTRIKGRATDRTTGEGIPFCAVFFDGTTIGVTTDLQGYYEIETRDTSARVLRASILGYEALSEQVRQHAFQELNFRLSPVIGELNASIVKPDNSRMKYILRQIDAHRSANDPEQRCAYECGQYTKMELDLTNAEQWLGGKAFRKRFGFVFDQIDTSVISGQPYLPIMISETKSRRYHSPSPEYDRELIEASRISGLNNTEVAAQFTGNTHLKTNFYRPFIKFLNIELPSPIGTGADAYYNYYLIDSLQIEGRNTWMIRFHPKKFVTTPTFDGEMMIDSQDYALREIHARLQKGSNVNWIRDLVIQNEYQSKGDSAWFYKSDRVYADFSFTPRDSSRIVSIIAHRDVTYSDPEYVQKLSADAYQDGDRVKVLEDAVGRDETYWEQTRPYALSGSEKETFAMVDSVKRVPAFNTIYSIAAALVEGYYDHGPIGYGPVSKIISFNDIDGARVELGARTSKAFSHRLRLSGSLSYGFKSRSFMGGARLEYMFDDPLYRKLTISGRRGLQQLGKTTTGITDDNILSSLLTKSGTNRRSPVTEFRVKYEHDYLPGFECAYSIDYQDISANDRVPMVRPDGTPLSHLASITPHYSARLSWDEAVTRGVFARSHVYTKYPVVYFDLLGAIPKIAGNDYSYIRAELSAKYRLNIPPIGVSYFTLNTGHIFGQVPYTMLKLHEGNGTYILDKKAFTCMDYYEFASDTWVQLFWEHNFGGLILGQIPLLKRAQLREVVTLKAAYGTLSEHNSTNAVLQLPFGMSSLEQPYVEMGVGITNILRIARVDCTWRLTHRDSPHPFAVTFGIDVNF